jgi:hypothetical protein
MQRAKLFRLFFKATCKTTDLSTDPEMTPARNAIDVRVQDLVASDELLLSEYKCRVHLLAASYPKCLTLLVWTSRKLVDPSSSSQVFSPLASSRSHSARHSYYTAGNISLPVVCTQWTQIICAISIFNQWGKLWHQNIQT